MRKTIKIPRIIKIEKVDGFRVYCMFNNGESRIIDFKALFDDWEVSSADIEYPLLNQKEFSKVKLRNFTLSWDNVSSQLIDVDGKEQEYPYEIGPDILYQNSIPNDSADSFKIGLMIKTARQKAGLTQEQLAERSGTTRFYISRLENDKTDIELSTIRKIIEAGLGKDLRLQID
jgi:DNA-binding XRE family transcriptional regulator